jgi:amphi-Trp domain-containing protein
MTGKAKFEYSAMADGARVAEYLTRIAEGFASGSISLAAQSESIDLTPGGVVKVTIEADGNPTARRGSLNLTISWKAASDNHQDGLEISTSPRAEAAVTPPADGPRRSRRGAQPRE